MSVTKNKNSTRLRYTNRLTSAEVDQCATRMEKGKMNTRTKAINEKPFVEEENFTSKDKVKIVDLFAGIGGFHYGIAAAAAKINHGVKPLLVSEIEPSCQETYSKNHKCEVQ